MKKSQMHAAMFLSAFTYSASAHAYLDPGTGSMLLQLLLGGVAGLVVVGRLYWEKVKNFFMGRSKSFRSDTEKDESQ